MNKAELKPCENSENLKKGDLLGYTNCRLVKPGNVVRIHNPAPDDVAKDTLMVVKEVRSPALLIGMFGDQTSYQHVTRCTFESAALQSKVG